MSQYFTHEEIKVQRIDEKMERLKRLTTSAISESIPSVRVDLFTINWTHDGESGSVVIKVSSSLEAQNEFIKNLPHYKSISTPSEDVLPYREEWLV